MRTLNSPVLVLNKSWAAIGTTTVRDALCAILKGAAAGMCIDSFTLYDWETWSDKNARMEAGLLDPVTEGAIRSASSSIPAPEVVVLTRYDRLRVRKPAFSQHRMFIRDQYHCQYCEKRLSFESLTIDHVIPRSKGGTTSWENCVSACLPCNQKKADKTPREAGMRLKAKPVQPQWSPVMHIAPAKRPDSWKVLIGKTA